MRTSERAATIATLTGGIMFHHFHGAGHAPGQGSISAADLETLIAQAGRERILPAREWLQRARKGALAPRDLCLTFDDDLRCQYDVARPVLERHGLTAFWFVYTSVLDGRPERLEIYRAFRTRCFASVDAFYDAFFTALARGAWAGEVDARLAAFRPAEFLPHSPFYSDADRRFRFVRDDVLGPARYDAAMDALLAAHGVSAADLAPGLWMDADALLALHRAGHVVGLHSHTHPTRMGELDEDVQRQEYAANADAVTRVTGCRPRAMSHPCNSYDARTLRVLAGLGVEVGFRADTSRAAAGPLEHPRLDHAVALAELGR